jgi:hypothetical protein
MSYSIWGSIAEVSWWVYPVLIFSLMIAFRSTKSHYIDMKRFIFLPYFPIVMLILLMPFSITLTANKMMLFSAAIFPSMLAGWLQFRLRKIKALKNQSQFFVPGSWAIFFIILIAIAARIYFYGFNFAITIDPYVLQKEQYTNIVVTLCSICAGLTIGRSIYLYRCMKFGPYL